MQRLREREGGEKKTEQRLDVENVRISIKVFRVYLVLLLLLLAIVTAVVLLKRSVVLCDQHDTEKQP